MRKIIAFLFVLPFFGLAQNNSGEIHGDFDLSLQTYNEDESIGALAADEVILNNAYFNLLYTKGKFTVGVRYESYLNALKDFDPRYNGNGIPYRFAQYNNDGLEITAGSFYEQFGSGLILRSYEEKTLGIDNAMDGIRLRYSPISGVYLKTFIGRERKFFEYSKGIVRGADGEVNINDILKLTTKTKAILGGSVVSRFQNATNPNFNIPENVSAFAGRMNIISGGLNWYSEYACKINDPIGSLTENNYANGSAITSNLTYSQKGIGISLEAHRVDNMVFRADRDAVGKDLLLNYIPSISKQHAYTLVSLYPYATQPNGEAGFQIDLFYKLEKGNWIGGKYGTKLDVNFSRINALNGGPSYLSDDINHEPMLVSLKGEALYYQDFNVEITRKINRKVKIVVVLAKQSYNKDVVQQQTGYGIIESDIAVLDLTYKIKKGHSIRVELQELKTEQDDGDWSMGLAEYTISPHWFFAIQDLYNWGNKNPDKQLHYFNADVGYIKGANRFTIGYGKKREGIFCVGGVCKTVPSSNGLTLSISSSF
ncbi:MAG: DUF6029 family protein [Flavobacteriales bacterium]|jgi:hypothetical protein|nr:DUF6029 family protein [Flavobacteriales bacterium]HJN64190.1 DUF6029 family protein [Flavobacteriales bacterium]|tara:strand:+ start:1945 stop:3561 length:1617 start_codon:yes stop_codon:yes gene_type:complete